MMGYPTAGRMKLNSDSSLTQNLFDPGRTERDDVRQYASQDLGQQVTLGIVHSPQTGFDIRQAARLRSHPASCSLAANASWESPTRGHRRKSQRRKRSRSGKKSPTTIHLPKASFSRFRESRIHRRGRCPSFHTGSRGMGFTASSSDPACWLRAWLPLSCQQPL